MSEQEIIDAKKELSERFSPEILEFLKKRGQEKMKKSKDMKKENSSSIPTVPSIPIVENIIQPVISQGLPKDVDLSKIGNEAELTQAEIKYLSPYEKAKLEWLKPLPESKPHKDTNHLHSTRFNFDGNTISNEESIPVTNGLHISFFFILYKKFNYLASWYRT